MLSLFIEIDAAMQELTDDDMRRVEQTFQPPQEGEKVIGVVDESATRRLFAVAYVYKGRCAQLSHRAAYEAANDQERDELTQEAKRFNALEDASRECFWCQAKMDIGAKAWATSGLGLRRGFTLVSTADGGLPSFIDMVGKFTGK